MKYCRTSTVCIGTNLKRQVSQSLQQRRPLLGPTCAPDLVRALRSALSSMLEPKPSWQRLSWYILALTIQSRSSLFYATPKMDTGEVYGRRIPPPAHIF
jgi:hypothetical protein